MALRDQNGLDSCTCSPSPLYNWPTENGGAKERYFQIAKHCYNKVKVKVNLI